MNVNLFKSNSYKYFPTKYGLEVNLTGLKLKNFQIIHLQFGPFIWIPATLCHEKRA